jgi:hypothetical protein
MRPHSLAAPPAPSHRSSTCPATPGLGPPPCRPSPCSTATRPGVPKRPAEVAAQLDACVVGWGGDKPIHSVLVANNGLAATKFMRSVRSWAYKNFGNERAGGRGGGAGWLVGLVGGVGWSGWAG